MTMLPTRFMTRLITKSAVVKHPNVVFASKTAERVTEAMHARKVRSKRKQVPAEVCLKSACQPDAPHEGSLGRTTPAGEPAPGTTAASCMPGSAAAIAAGDDMLLRTRCSPPVTAFLRDRSL